MRIQTLPKKPTNLSLDQALLTEARAHGVNLSQAAEAGLKIAIRAAKAEAWKRENAGALSASNDWADENGLPLAQYRPY